MSWKEMQAVRPRWPWRRFKGSHVALTWSARDLANLELALAVTPGRKLVVQAGGNLGIFPKRLAEVFETVVTFEPSPELYGILKHNAPESNIVAHQAALGASRESVGMRAIRRTKRDKPPHEGITHVFGSGAVSQVLLDDLKLSACDLIYLDIEGFEMYALMGARNTILKYKPVIGLELNGNGQHYGVSDDSIRAWLADLGYKLSARIRSDEVYVPW